MKRKTQKILLINPPAIVKQSWVEDVQSFPLGLAFIAAVLQKNDYEVKILDCFIEDVTNKQPINNGLIRIGISDDEIADIIKEYSPDLVGISMQFSIQLNSAIHVNTLIKKINKNIITVTGGNHVSAAPETIVNNNIDWLIIGEGEFRLLNALNENSTDTLPPEIVHLSENVSLPDLSKNKPKYIEDLNSLPMPQYDLLSLDKYWAASGGRRWANIFTTRGCPYNCVFCSIHTIMGKKVRYKSVDAIFEEIILLSRKLGVKEIYIEDDNLTNDINWAKELFRKIIQEKLGLSFYLRNGVRADKLDIELLRLMKKAGVKSISLAPESGSQETLNNIISKKMDLADCEKAVKMASKAGIYVLCYLVIGFPKETLEDVQTTIKYARKLKNLGCDNVFISCAVPYPGTRLFDECIESKIISTDNFDYQELATMGSVIHNKWFTADELKQIRDKAMQKLTSNLKLQLLKLLLVNPFMFFAKTKNIILRRF